MEKQLYLQKTFLDFYFQKNIEKNTGGCYEYINGYYFRAFVVGFVKENEKNMEAWEKLFSRIKEFSPVKEDILIKSTPINSLISAKMDKIKQLSRKSGIPNTYRWDIDTT